TFRGDLFYRLAGVQLEVPSLDQRRDDVPALVAHFCRELKLSVPLPANVLEQLCAGSYPGNARELKHAVARAALGIMPSPATASGAELSTDEAYWPQRERHLAALEQRYLVRLLDSCGGNVSDAARRSGISRVQMYAMLHRHGLSAARRR